MIVDMGQMVTQEQFGKMVGISQPAVSGLIERGVIGRSEPVGNWLADYCRNLREQAAGRGSEEGGGELVRERARLAKEQADKIGMQNAQARRELAPVALLENVLADVGRQIAKQLEAIVPNLKRRADLTTEALEFVEREIVKARNLASTIELELDDDNVQSGNSESDTRGLEEP